MLSFSLFKICLKSDFYQCFDLSVSLRVVKGCFGQVCFNGFAVKSVWNSADMLLKSVVLVTVQSVAAHSC